MSWWKNVVKYAAPVAGAVGGSLLGPSLGIGANWGGAIGGGLGGVIGNEVGGGGGFGGDLLLGGAGALGGYLAGPTIANWAGVPAAGGVTSAAGSALPNSGGGLDDLVNRDLTGATAGSLGAGQGVGWAGSIMGNQAGEAASGGLGGFTEFLKNNPALGAVGAGILGQAVSPAVNSLFAPSYPGQKELTSLAKQAGKTGRMLSSYYETGQLPPGAQSAVDQAVSDAQTAIKANYANMGLSGSSMETQDLAAAAARGKQLGFQLASQVAETGLSQLSLSSQIYGGIMQAAMQQDSELSAAIAKLAGSTGYSQGATQ